MVMFSARGAKPTSNLIVIRVERGEDKRGARDRAKAQAGGPVEISTVVNEVDERGKRTGVTIYTYRRATL